MAWYKESFGEDYLIVYKHRDLHGARQEVKRMVDWLQLPEGATIFDLCCGMGRHSMILSEFGYDVTGMDLSEVLLQEAKKADEQKQIRWLHGDMRQIPVNEQYDAVVNLFTSFGYFEDDQENQQVLHEMNRILKPDGRFIIDFLNPEYVKLNLVPSSERETDGLVIKEQRSIEGGYVQKRIQISEEGQPERRYLERVRLYELAQFEKMLKIAELSLSHVYGDYKQSAYDPATSPRMIMVGNKEE